MSFSQTFFHNIYQFFYGTIHRWNTFLLSLEDDEKQLITNNYVFPKKIEDTIHAPMKSFQEDTFAYNIEKDKKVLFTGNENADKWIRDYSVLNIDIFHLIQSELTLPDLTFIKKRYYLLAKQIHPDKTQSFNKQMDNIIQLNTAYQELSEDLYENIYDQVNLFQAVFDKIFHNIQNSVFDKTSISSNLSSSTSSYIILYLVGVAIGSIIVFKKINHSKQKKNQDTR